MNVHSSEDEYRSTSRQAQGQAELAARIRLVVGTLARSTRRADRMPRVSATVLGLLERQDDPPTIADLANLRQVRHQTMASTVSELVEAGLVHAQAHRSDGRKKVLGLTTQGRAALRDDEHRREQALATAIARTLSQHEQADLARGLELLARVATKMDTPQAAPSRDASPEV